LLNVLLFLFFGQGAFYGLQRRLAAGLTAVDVSFIAQNVIFCLVILVRSPDREMSRSLAGQLFALAAFFSGLAFLNVDLVASGVTAGMGKATMVLANILAIGSLLSLGKSFGILIARRKLKTNGLYGLVRHPMYLSDILLRLGFFLVHPGIAVSLLVIASIFLYGARAAWEERFLGQRDDYRAYCRTVRHRFVPWLY
jgi:protein-S-isoprenylcysteine O-methyltransferase Ste14